MMLHIYIAGEEMLRSEIEPDHVDEVLRRLEWYLPKLAERGRITATLDSGVHQNVTYLLNRGHQ